jgi:hypothetical protein
MQTTQQSFRIGLVAFFGYLALCGILLGLNWTM